MSGLLLWIFGFLTVYLVVAEIAARARFRRRESALWDVRSGTMTRERLLSEIRGFLAEKDISEEWLLAYGGEKEEVSCLPGSIFGRCVVSMEFGHRLPVSRLDELSDRQLRRIFARRTALCEYRNGKSLPRPAPRGSLYGQAC